MAAAWAFADMPAAHAADIAPGTTLLVTDQANLGSTTDATTVQDGGTLEISGDIRVEQAGFTISGSGVGNAGAIRNLSGDNTLLGTIYLSPDWRRINSDAGLLTFEGDFVELTPGGDGLIFGGAGDIRVEGGITLPDGEIYKDGGGVLTLAGTNTARMVEVLDGELRLAEGGQITDVPDTAIRDGAQATVTGTGSSWTTDDLSLDGGTLRVEDEGRFEANQSFINSGDIVVTGSDSSFVSVGDFMVGRGTGPTSVSVEAGGHLSAYRTFFGEGKHVNAASLKATVTGPGSLWEAGNFLAIGGNAPVPSEIAILDGGVMTVDGTAIIGRGGPGTGIVSDAGSELRLDNSTLEIGAFFDGESGDGTLTVENGGLVAADTVLFGTEAASTGRLHLNGTPGDEGVLLASTLWKDDGSGSVYFDGGILRAMGDSDTFIEGFDLGDVVIQPGNMFVDSNGYTVTVSSPVTGTGDLVKLGAGTLILTNENVYDGRTEIVDGTLQLGDGGTSGSIPGDVANDGILAFNRSDVVTFDGMVTGTGGIHQIGTGTTILTNDSSGLGGISEVHSGILAVNGSLGGTMDVLAGRLQGGGFVGATTNHAGGTIAPGNSIDTLTVLGDYTGAGGTLEIEAVLGDDSSAADLLVVTGSTFGTTNVEVVNLGGAGAATVEGIRIVDVGGASNGTFALQGNYVFNGEQAVVAGAYAYRLYQHGVSTPADGDWYLRSALLPTGGPGGGGPGGPTEPAEPVDPGEPVDPVDPIEPEIPVEPVEPTEPEAPVIPLYQPGAPVYETYAGVLQRFNGLDTLRQRAGNRSWTMRGTDAGVLPDTAGSGIWARIAAAHADIDPRSSTTGASYDSDSWLIQAGADGVIHSGADGDLLAGLSARYGRISADISSVFGDGSIDSTGYGLAGSLTWYGTGGVYLDAQASATWYDSDLSSRTGATGLVSGNKGFGYAIGAEAGRRFALDPAWSLTPQAQLVYSTVDFDGFTDVYGAAVSLVDGDSLRGRLGLSVDHENSWTAASGQTSRLNTYGIVNLYYEFLPKTSVDLAGVGLASVQDRLWGGAGIGGTYDWADGKFALHGEAAVNTSLGRFGDSIDMTAKGGLRVRF